KALKRRRPCHVERREISLIASWAIPKRLTRDSLSAQNDTSVSALTLQPFNDLTARSAFLAARIISYNDFQLNFLKRQLIMDVTEQFKCVCVGHVRTTQFDSCWFTGKCRMRFRHFAIEQK